VHRRLEMICARLALRGVLMIVHCGFLMLIVVSMIEVFETIAGIIRDLEKDNEILLVGALVAALVPSGAVLFWGCKAIAVHLDLPIKKVHRYFGASKQDLIASAPDRRCLVRPPQ